MAQQAERVYPGAGPCSQTSFTNLADTSKPARKGPFSRGNLQSWRPDSLALHAGPPHPTQLRGIRWGTAVLEGVGRRGHSSPFPSHPLLPGLQSMVGTRVSFCPYSRVPSQSCPFPPSRQERLTRGSLGPCPSLSACMKNYRGTDFVPQAPLFRKGPPV